VSRSGELRGLTVNGHGESTLSATLVSGGGSCQPAESTLFELLRHHGFEIMTRLLSRLSSLGACLFPIAFLVGCGSRDDPAFEAMVGAGGTGAGVGGEAGAGGSKAGASAPNRCEEAHGAPGCCSADHKTVFHSLDGQTVSSVTCTGSEVCSWTGQSYQCAMGLVRVDPSGLFPLTCGKVISNDKTGCPTACKDDSDCAALKNTPVCDTKNGVCVECVTNDTCAGNSKGPVCDATASVCVECSDDDDCKGHPVNKICNTKSNQCVECVSRSDCADSKHGPACDTDGGHCAECTTDEDCADNEDGFVCSAGIQALVCGCRNDFDCYLERPHCHIENPFSGGVRCMPVPPCTGDDAFEDADDSPLGATDITPTSGDKSTITNHVICGNHGEQDYFKFTASDGDDVVVSLSWADTTQSLRIDAKDPKDLRIGIYTGGVNASVMELRYLSGGVYYFAVAGGVAGGVTPYTLEFTRTTSKCTSITDCAKDAGPMFRGDCSAAGACEFIDGQGKVAQGGVCDSNDDCASGLCAETFGNSNPAKFAFCTVACEQDQECPQDQLCFHSNFIGSSPYCTARCSKDTECTMHQSVELAGTYWTCDTATGVCHK
jgi:hypothetical protein